MGPERWNAWWADRRWRWQSRHRLRCPFPSLQSLYGIVGLLLADMLLLSGQAVAADVGYGVMVTCLVLCMLRAVAVNRPLKEWQCGCRDCARSLPWRKWDAGGPLLDGGPSESLAQVTCRRFGLRPVLSPEVGAGQVMLVRRVAPDWAGAFAILDDVASLDEMLARVVESCVPLPSQGWYPIGPWLTRVVTVAVERGLVEVELAGPLAAGAAELACELTGTVPLAEAIDAASAAWGPQ